jgi:putative redox protein
LVEIHLQYPGDLRCRAVHAPSSTELVTDPPVDNAGRGESFSPTDLVATALGACMLTIMGIAARKNDWNIDGATATVVKGMVNAPVRRVARLGVELRMPNDPGAEARATLERAAMNCPVWHSLNPDIEIPVRFTWGS